jgi:hypothetical protein
VAVAVSTGQRVTFYAPLSAIASKAGLARIGVPWAAAATGAAAPTFATKRNVLRTRRFPDPRDGRAQHLFDVLELPEVVGGYEGQ